uniref:ATP synthase F0 subunit 8 n=1 Tax=Mastinocerus sp. MAS01 TaxID=1205632 RepID=A0A0S2MP62_9COLE|nr:ATP synthase F0 subunit 8 [Mastinocerus sp. MAS01]
MPHMSPIWWLNMMLFYMILMLMVNSLIYSIFGKKMLKKKKTKFTMNWKW